MTATFAPQPYPLYAIPLTVAQDPARFEVTDDRVQFVLGWRTDDAGVTLPVLSSAGPSGAAWDGPILYELREQDAKDTATKIDKAERAAVRDARMIALFDRWEAWTDRISQRMEERLDRVGPR